VHIWVVEMLVGEKWRPTHSHEITREDGRIKLCEWSEVCPHEKFRLRKYIREE